VVNSDLRFLASGIHREVVTSARFVVESCFILVMVVVPGLMVITCVGKSVSLMIKTHLVGHSVPISVELFNSALVHIPENVLLMRISAHSLLDHLAASVVKHSFVRHFLCTQSLIFVHLLAFSDTFSVGTHGALRAYLVTLFDRLTITANFGGLLGLHRLETRASSQTLAHVSFHRLVHSAVHI
jgi:hypothetical protein